MSSDIVYVNDKVVKVASLRRMHQAFLIVAAATLGAYVITIVLINTIFGLGLLMIPVSGLLSIATMVLAILLGTLLGWSTGTLAAMVLLLVPVINLGMILFVNKRATQAMKQARVHVGMLGSTTTGIPANVSKLCPRCGNITPTDATTCASCGQSLGFAFSPVNKA